MTEAELNELKAQLKYAAKIGLENTPGYRLNMLAELLSKYCQMKRRELREYYKTHPADKTH